MIVIPTVGFFLVSTLREGDRPVDQAEVDAVRLAVLPLGEHGLTEDDHFLAEALTDQLIAELTRIEGLSVIAMASVLPYRTGDREVEEIGRSSRLIREYLSGMRNPRAPNVNDLVVQII